MKLKSTNSDINYTGRISTGRLIIASICLVAALSACTPHAVRYNADVKKTRVNAKTSKAKPDEEKIDLADDKAAAIKEFEKNVMNKKKNEAPKVQQTSSETSVLPSLKDQLDFIADEQVQIKNKVVVLQNDVIEMKYALEEIKDGLQTAKILKKNKVFSGSEVDTTPEDTKAASSGIIPSDEDLNKTKEAEKPKSAPKKVTPAKKSDIKSVEKKDKNKALSMKSGKKGKNVDKEETKVIPAKAVDTKSNMSEALACISKKDYKTASQKMTEILKTSKDAATIADCNYWLGECSFQMKDYSKALEYYNKTLKLGKKQGSDGAQVKVAECLIKTGQIPEAKAAFKTLIDKYPGSEFIPKAKKMLQQL